MGFILFLAVIVSTENAGIPRGSFLAPGSMLNEMAGKEDIVIQQSLENIKSDRVRTQEHGISTLLEYRRLIKNGARAVRIIKSVLCHLKDQKESELIYYYIEGLKTLVEMDKDLLPVIYDSCEWEGEKIPNLRKWFESLSLLTEEEKEDLQPMVDEIEEQ